MRIVGRPMMLDEDHQIACLAQPSRQRIQPCDQSAGIVASAARREGALLHVDDEHGRLQEYVLQFAHRGVNCDRSIVAYRRRSGSVTARTLK